MKPPSEEARRVLQHYKEASSLGAEQKTRLGDVVRERVLRGDLPRFDLAPAAPAAHPPSLLERLWSSVAGKVALGVAAIGAAASAGYQLLDKEPSSQHSVAAAVVARAAATPREVASSSLAAAAEQQVPVADETAKLAPSVGVRVHAERPVVPSASASSEPTVDDEVKLMNASQAALRAGKPAQALELLAQHAARFPSGKLTTLREVTRMMALCQAGRAAQARQEAADFISKRPDSPFVERVKTICADR